MIINKNKLVHMIADYMHDSNPYEYHDYIAQIKLIKEYIGV